MLAAFVLMLAGCGTLSEEGRKHAVRLGFDSGGYCSGTVVGPNEILSARHCFSANLATVDGENVVVLANYPLDHDQHVVKVGKSYKRWAIKSPIPVRQGDRVSFTGNPYGLSTAYREGYVSAFKEGSIVVDIEAGRGDSGAGLFNKRGELVGVISSVFYAESFRMTIAWPPEGL